MSLVVADIDPLIWHHNAPAAEFRQWAQLLPTWIEVQRPNAAVSSRMGDTRNSRTNNHRFTGNSHQREQATRSSVHIL